MTASSSQLRWVNLGAAVLLLICTGSICTFSVFSGPLADLRGWSGSEVALGFAISAALSPIPIILGGKLVDFGHARASMIVGGLMFGLAFVAAGLIPSLAGFYFAYGILGGLGAGFAYSGAIGNVIRYFPDRRGMATGLVTAENGAAAVITAPLVGALIQSQGVSLALLILGAGFLVAALLCFLVLRTAPPDYRPEGWTPPVVKATPQTHDVNWRAMLGRPAFCVLLFMMAAGATSGLMIAAKASQIGQHMFGLSATTAALYVGFYSVSNDSGRFFRGVVSDRIGRVASLICIFFAGRIGAARAVSSTRLDGLSPRYPWRRHLVRRHHGRVSPAAHRTVWNEEFRDQLRPDVHRLLDCSIGGATPRRGDRRCIWLQLRYSLHHRCRAQFHWRRRGDHLSSPYAYPQASRPRCKLVRTPSCFRRNSPS